MFMISPSNLTFDFPFPTDLASQSLHTCKGSSLTLRDFQAPRLPRELERYIFELGAKEDRNTALNVILVARRAQIWIEPILYQKVVLRSSVCETQDTFSKFLYTISRRPSSFFTRHVRSLLITAPMSAPPVDVEEVLSVCRRLTAFGWCSPHRIPQDAVQCLNQLLSLRRLAIAPHSLSVSLSDDDSKDGQGQSNSWSLPLFRFITHLELTYLPPKHYLFHASQLPNLRYLAFNDLSNSYDAQILLNERPSLRAMAFVNTEGGFNAAELKRMSKGIDDARFVTLDQHDWFPAGWTERHGGWTDVQDILNQRRIAKSSSTKHC